MKRINLQCSLLSHFDTMQYSAEEIATMALECQEAGASVVHVHINKLGSIAEFMRMADILEKSNGPFLSLSVSDYKMVVSWSGRRPSVIRFASMQGADCCVFGNHISQSLNNAKIQMSEYIENGFVPEVSVFNFKGVSNCLELNNYFPQKFCVGVYLGYPGELPALVEIARCIMKQLRCCSHISFTLYNNQDDELLRYIINNGGHIRSGLEDNAYRGAIKAENSIDIVKYISAIIRDCGHECTVHLINGFNRNY